MVDVTKNKQTNKETETPDLVTGLLELIYHRFRHASLDLTG